MRFLKHPSEKDEFPTIPWEQRNFTALYRDPPATVIPNTSVADARNVLLFGERFRARFGVKRWSKLTLPTIPGRNNYTIFKTGNIVRTGVPQIPFVESDVGRFIVWPDGFNDLIVEFVSPQEVIVEDDTPHLSTVVSGAFSSIRGRLNQWHRFAKKKQVYIHIDTRVFFTDYQMGVWTEVINKSAQLPAESKSEFDDYKDAVYLFTSDGHFKIDPDTTVIEMVHINSKVPDNTITRIPSYESEETDSHRFGRRYLFSLARQVGFGFDDRSVNRIQKETGVNDFPGSRDYRDWEAVFKEVEFSEGGGKLGDLTGAQTTTPTTPLHDWEAVAEGSFTLDIGGNVREVVCDFSTIETWFDIAAEIQARLRATFPETEGIVCSYLSDVEQFFVLPGKVTYSIPFGNFSNGVAGTNLFTAAFLNFANTRIGNATALLGTLAVAGLQIPAGQYGWTHYSLYSTLTLGAEFAATNPEDYVWQRDIPVAKTFIVSSSGGTIDILSGDYEFEIIDVSSQIRFEDGSVFEILEFLSSTSLSVGVSPFASQAATIGADRCMTASKILSLIKRESGSLFVASDVGKTAYWSDGTYSHIISVSSNGEFATASDLDSKSSSGLALDPSGRNYRDDVPDQILLDRAKAFPLIQRLWLALPNGNLGQIVPGFFVISSEDETKFFYSQLSDSFEYLVGHHNPEFQFNSVKDAIKSLREFPSQLIIYCANSVWRTQINVVEFVEELRAGITVAIMSGLGTVDEFIGIMDKGGIKRIGDGIEVIITSEPGLRLFDGRQFSDDLTVDSEGRGHIKCDLQEFRSTFSMAYEPNIFGIIFWGAKKSLIKGLGENFVPDLSFRRAIEPEHGFSFSELFGRDWIYPELGINSLQLLTIEGESATVMMDAKSGRACFFATRLGPEGSILERLFVDDCSEGEYSIATEIPWEILYKEHTGTEERFKIRHMETHNFFRPEEESDKNRAGHDANGFRNAQEISVKAYINGKLEEESEAVNVPNNGDVTFTKQIEGRRIQLRVSGTASSIQGITHKTLYDLLLVGSDPDDKNINEAEIESLLATPIFWLSRGRYQGLNLATGNPPTSGATPATIPGPDGKPDSAFQPVRIENTISR